MAVTHCYWLSGAEDEDTCESHRHEREGQSRILGQSEFLDRSIQSVSTMQGLESRVPVARLAIKPEAIMPTKATRPGQQQWGGGGGGDQERTEHSLIPIHSIHRIPA